MPFTMNAVGRLAHEPVLNMGRGQPWTEFRLLDNRMSRGEKITEAVTFVAFGDLAQQFCERVQKGQEIHAWGRQETDRYTDREGVERTRVRFILFHFDPGRRPSARSDDQSTQHGEPQRQAPRQQPQRTPSPPPEDQDDHGHDSGII